MDLNKEKNFVSAVVFCHNEAATIGNFIENLDKTLNDNFLKYEIIIVNGACTDNTIEIVKEYAKTKVGLVISILNLSINWGYEYGVNAGIDLSIGDYIFEFNSSKVDYEWSLLMKMYYKSMEGYDFVCAVSDRRASFSNRFFNSIFNKNAPLAYKISQSSFRLISRRGINRVKSITKTVVSRTISYARCGLPMTELLYRANRNVPSPVIKESKILTSILLYTNLGSIYSTRIVKYMVLLLLFSIIYIIGNTILTGTCSKISIIAVVIEIFFTILFALVTAVIIYLKAVIDFVFKKKDAIFVSIEKLSNQ